MHKIGEDITNMGGGMNYINCECITETGYDNLIQITGASATTQGLTITVNNDNSFKVEGTASADATYVFLGTSTTYPLELEAGTYKLIGGVSSDCFLRLYDGANTYNDFGEGTTFTLTEKKNFNCRLRVNSGVTVNTTIYPVLMKVM